MTRGHALSLFVRRLVKAPPRTRRLILIVFAATTALGGWWLGAPGALTGLIAGVLPAYLLLNLGGTENKSYSLFYDAGDHGLQLMALLDKLAGHGYRLEALASDSDGNPSAPLAPTTPLLGPDLWLRVAGRRGGVRVRLYPSQGTGEVDSADGSSGLYEELGQFTILSLGELLRGLTFKQSFSSLSAETVEWLRPQLPERPRHLPP
jgi:hypothetical protein